MESETLTFIGDGEELEDLRNEYSTKRNIVFKGKIRNTELLIALTQALVHTIISKENFIKDDYKTQDIGEHSLKGFEKPVKVYKLDLED